MSLPENEIWVGQLSLARLFEGSKSEGLYPVLDADDGRRYRVHIKGNGDSDVEALGSLMNQRVCLQGIADDLRGHWRLILDPAMPMEIRPIKHSPEVPPTATANQDAS